MNKSPIKFQIQVGNDCVSVDFVIEKLFLRYLGFPTIVNRDSLNRSHFNILAIRSLRKSNLGQPSPPRQQHSQSPASQHKQGERHRDGPVVPEAILHYRGTVHIPLEYRHCEDCLKQIKHKPVLKRELESELTATKVPGKNNMPSVAIVFIAELSRLVSRAIARIAALSSLLALVIAAEFSAKAILIFASF